MTKIKGKLISVQSVTSYGNRRLVVAGRAVRHTTTAHSDGTISRELLPFGPLLEGIGGFKYAKDFDYNLAKQAALENLVAQL